MTFSFVQQVTMSETTGTGSYTSAAFSSALTVGNTLIAVVTTDGNNAGQITGVSDSKGNTWTKDVESIGATRSVTIWRAPITTGGTGATITVTYNAASSNNSGAVIQEWSGGTLVLDQIKTNSGTSATPTTGASPSTTVANELVVAGCVMNSTEASFTGAGAGYSNAGFVLVSNANAAMESAEVTVTGAQTATFTWPTSRAYATALATYYVSGGGGGSPTDTSKMLSFFF